MQNLRPLGAFLLVEIEFLCAWVGWWWEQQSLCQPNLRLGLTRLLLFIPPHPTPPPTRNSTSTRNKGPSGLKFCMRPHLTKLTTTQHKFNPTIFWVGGGSCRVNPTQIFFGQEKISDPNLFDQRFF